MPDFVAFLMSIKTIPVDFIRDFLSEIMFTIHLIGGLLNVTQENQTVMI